MQLFKSRSHFIFVEGDHCLWCNRFDGRLEAKPCSSIEHLSAFQFVSKIYGIVGKIRVFPDSEPKLLLVTQQSTVAKIKGHEILRIDRVGILSVSPIDPPEDERFFFTGKLDPDLSEPISDFTSDFNSVLVNRGIQKTLKTLRQATNLKFTGQNDRKGRTEKEKLERRILEDIAKMFNDSQFFYYSPTWDLTNTMQRSYKLGINKNHTGNPIDWRKADQRFFWNRGLWKDLETTGNPENDYWIVPVVMGYVEQRAMIIDYNSYDESGQIAAQTGEYVAPVCAQVTLISRRSRFRAGTRYKRRGIDESGDVANFVETEQIMDVMKHSLSFVQVRGSIPVYWSQPGMRYRPAPRLDRGEKECHEAFAKHFEQQLDLYKHQVLINLVEQSGKEKVLADAYLREIIHYDSEALIYVSFDFHEYCRGMRLENINVLIESLNDVFAGMRFFWMKSSEDGQEQVMCQQPSVFRVNCVDCLDRTNVIQAAIARFVLESQLRKLGLLLPEIEFPPECRQVLQIMWADNGDVISRQYAGTSALKGDVTRTGERNLAGLMKDGYTSANRYYLHQFKDAYRQAAIDATVGEFFREESLLIPGVTAPLVDPSEFDRIRQLVEDCKKILIPEGEVPLGGWPMVDAEKVLDDLRPDMDTVLLLSNQAYYIAEYSDESDNLVGYQRVPLEDVDSIEIGPETGMFRMKKELMRVNYRSQREGGYCHQLKSAGMRLFNSMIVPLNNDEETMEMLKSIAESFRMAIESLHNRQIPVVIGKLQKRVSRSPPKDPSVAPVESNGGIFSASLPSPLSSPRGRPAASAQRAPQLTSVLSAVRNKLVDFNPFDRIPLGTRSTRNENRTASEQPVAFSVKDGEKNVIIADLREKTQQSSVDSTDFVVVDVEPPKPNSQLNGAKEGVLLDFGTNGEISNQPPQVSGFLTPLKQSRSSRNLDSSLPPVPSPKVLSASSSMKNLENMTNEANSANAAESSNNAAASSSTSNGQKTGTANSSPGPSGRHGKDYEELRSVRACRTKIIKL